MSGPAAWCSSNTRCRPQSSIRRTGIGRGRIARCESTSPRSRVRPPRSRGNRPRCSISAATTGRSSAHTLRATSATVSTHPTWPSPLAIRTSRSCGTCSRPWSSTPCWAGVNSTSSRRSPCSTIWKIPSASCGPWRRASRRGGSGFSRCRTCRRCSKTRRTTRSVTSTSSITASRSSSATKASSGAWSRAGRSWAWRRACVPAAGPVHWPGLVARCG